MKGEAIRSGGRRAVRGEQMKGKEWMGYGGEGEGRGGRGAKK